MTVQEAYKIIMAKYEGMKVIDCIENEKFYLLLWLL